MDNQNAEQLLNAAIELHRAGDLAGAERGYRQVLTIDPAHTEAMHLLGVISATRRDFPQAFEQFQTAIRLRPGYALAYYNLGRAYEDAGQLADAVGAYQQAIAVRSPYPRAQNNLGVCLQKLGRFDEAMSAYDAAIAGQPAFPAAHFNRGTLLEVQGRLHDAIASYRTAIEQNPKYPDALTNLGNVLQKLGQFDQAIAALERSLVLKPQSPIALNSLGNALKETGSVNGALWNYAQAVEAAGGHWAAANYLYALHFSPDFDSRKIFDMHALWNEEYARQLQPITTPHVRASGRLRIGFVSPDFREHPVGRFMLPLAEKLDRSRFEVSYFSDTVVTDATTARFKSNADHWHNTARLTHAELAERVNANSIDVLIDLTMHMEGSRLLAFARKPARVQMTYLAYCSTTGLTAIDYRLSDPYLDPIGMDETVYSERTLRLPRTYWCYRPPVDAPAISLRGQKETVFGCLNNFCKISDITWRAWIDILRAVPDSKLVIFCPEGAHRRDVQQRLQSARVDPSRLTMIARAPRTQYLQTYGQIDIALDPFPYGGGTTTLDALWTGVPVVSLVGQTAVGRGGDSILSNIGRPQWLAHDLAGYVRIASELAGNRPDRAAFRELLRASPLMDEKQFARDFEAAIARAWHDPTGNVV